MAKRPVRSAIVAVSRREGQRRRKTDPRLIVAPPPTQNAASAIAVHPNPAHRTRTQVLLKAAKVYGDEAKAAKLAGAHSARG